MAEYLVLGLGRFGARVARELQRNGQSVLAVDRLPELVEQIVGEVDAAFSLDATDERAIAELDLERISCAVVAFGADSTEASILTTALLRQAGVERIIVRAVTALQERVLLAVGATEVINPEEAMGERLARRLSHPNVLEHLELGRAAQIAEIAAPAAFIGQTIRDLDVRRRFRLTVLVVRRGDRLIESGLGDLVLEQGDILVAVGSAEAIAGVGSLV